MLAGMAVTILLISAVMEAFGGWTAYQEEGLAAGLPIAVLGVVHMIVWAMLVVFN